MATAFGSSSNVFEVVDKDSYLDWSETTQAYLKAQDLWDVVHSDNQDLTGKQKKDWEKKNAAALHAIRISCGRQNLHFIRSISEANKAWQTLKETFDPQPEQPTNMASTSDNYSLDQITDEENARGNDYKKLFESLLDALSNKRWNDVKELCDKLPQKVWSLHREFSATLIIDCIKEEKLDIAKILLKGHSNLMLEEDANGKTPMYAAACASSLFRPTYHHRFLSPRISNWLGERLPLKLILKFSMMEVSGRELFGYMGKAIKDSEKDRNKTGLVNDALFEAIKRGNFLVFYTVLRKIRSMTLKADSYDPIKNMIIYAIKHRQPEVFSLLYFIFVHSNVGLQQFIYAWRDNLNSNILHIVGKLAPPAALDPISGKLAPPDALDRISGPALQVQRELKWLEVVEKLVPDPKPLRSAENIDHLTPRELFTINRKDLVLAGEKWMKDTASSCTIVGPLIITIMFAAAFQVPGGNDQEKGFPIFLSKFLFKLYIVLVAISFFSATTSVLVFLKILTTNYRVEDFLKSLPCKMIIGLSTLCLSLATMIVAFCSGLFLTLHGELGILIPIITLAAFPVGYFGWTQFPLLFEIWNSTRVAIYDEDIFLKFDPLNDLIEGVE